MAEQDRDGAYEIRVSKSTSGVFNSSNGTKLGGATVALGSNQGAAASDPARAPNRPRMVWMVPVGLSAGLLAVGAVVAFSSSAAPPSPVDFSDRETIADDVGPQNDERRTRRRIPNDGFRVYQGEIQTSAFPRETATINFASTRTSTDAGAEGSTELTPEPAPSVEPFAAPDLPSDSLEPEVIDRMRDVPVRIEGPPQEVQLRAVLGQPGGVLIDQNEPEEASPESEQGEENPEF